MLMRELDEFLKVIEEKIVNRLENMSGGRREPRREKEKEMPAEKVKVINP